MSVSINYSVTYRTGQVLHDWGQVLHCNIFPDPELWEVVFRLFGRHCGANGKRAAEV